MPAVVYVQQPGRACRIRCTDCNLDAPFDRTAPAQDYARQHNLSEHAYPEQPLDLDLDLDTDQETA